MREHGRLSLNGSGLFKCLHRRSPPKPHFPLIGRLGGFDFAQPPESLLVCRADS